MQPLFVLVGTCRGTGRRIGQSSELPLYITKFLLLDYAGSAPLFHGGLQFLSSFYQFRCFVDGIQLRATSAGDDFSVEYARR